MSLVTTWTRFIAISVLLVVLALATAGQAGEDQLPNGDRPPSAVPAGAELIPLPPAGDPEPNDTLATAVETGLIDEGEVTVVAAVLGDGDFPERDVDLFRAEIPGLDSPLDSVVSLHSSDGVIATNDNAPLEKRMVVMERPQKRRNQYRGT